MSREKSAAKIKRGKSPWKRPWSRQQGPIASFFSYHGSIAIQCEYSPARVKAIKGIPGARYSGERKEWRIPRERLDLLLGGKEFPPTQILNGLPLASDVSVTVSESQAYEQLKLNPFSVREEVIAALPIDMVIRSDRSKGKIKAIPAFASEAKKVLDRFVGALYSSFDSAYTLPTERVPDLLKELRDAKSLFAVDCETGDLLRETSTLRASICKSPESAKGNELQEALLTPFVVRVWDDESSSYRFRPCYFTFEQFKLAFPGVRKASRTRRPPDESGAPNVPFTLDGAELLHLIGRRSQIPFSIWLSKECAQVVEEERARLLQGLATYALPISDSVADLVTVPILWRIDSGGAATLQLATCDPLTAENVTDSGDGLIADSSLSNAIYTLVAPQLGLLATPPTRAVSLFIRDSKLLSIYGEVELFCSSHNLPPPPETENFSRLLGEIRERIALRERSAFYTNLENVTPSDLPELQSDKAAKLFPHQRVAVKWLLLTPSAFLGDDMGLGKTLSVLSYYEALRAGPTAKFGATSSRDGREPENDDAGSLGYSEVFSSKATSVEVPVSPYVTKRTFEGTSRDSSVFDLLLVICPNSLTRNWLREIQQWYPDVRAVVLSGDRNEKAWALRLLTNSTVDTDIVIINYEAVRLDYIAPEISKLCEQRKTLLCLDESQRVKNPTSKTFKAIAEIAPLCERRILLSGTPTPKDVTDLWAQMRILDGGTRFGKSFYRWLEQIAELGNEYSEFGIKKFRQAEVEESIVRVHEIMLRRKKERVVHLPEKMFILREVQMTGAQKRQYDEIREGLVLRMRSTSGEQFIREITNILEEYLRAVQVASNPRLIDPEWQGTPAKFAELDEIVHEVVREGEQKIVIWSNYLGNIRELKERYSDLGAEMFSGEVSASDRASIVKRFQEEETPKVLVAVPAAGGVGITLTRAQTAVYLDKTWNAEHWMQSVDRIHRIGQTGTVTIISLVASKVDEVIHWNLRKKERAQAEVLGDNGTRSLPVGLPSREELIKALEE